MEERVAGVNPPPDPNRPVRRRLSPKCNSGRAGARCGKASKPPLPEARLSTDPDHPDALLRRASQLLREGRGDEAIAAHERLLALFPNLPDSWFNLAWLQRSERRFEAALASYAEAVRRGVRAPEEAHLNRAVILSEHLDRTAEAEAELGQAVAANPRFLPAWLNLGNLHEDLGQAEKARDAYRRAIEIDPGCGRALARLAAIDVFAGDAEATIAPLRQTLALPGLDPDSACEIGFALGNALDAAGRYDEALAAFEAANRQALAIAPPTARYDRAASEALVDSLIATFPLAAQAPPTAGQPPIFICGMFRSGSTLAERILGRHSQVTPGGEFDALPVLVATELQPYPQAIAPLSPDRLDGLVRKYLSQLRALYPDAGLITDKRPDNFLHIGLIKAMFPEARIVHSRRDPFDNILSIYALYFQHNVSYGFDLDDAAHWYRQYRRLMRHWQAVWPSSIHDFDYDAAVRAPRGEIERLLVFCGLPWEDACLEPGRSPGAVRTASVWQVRQPIHARSSGRWRNYARHLERVRAALEEP